MRRPTLRGVGARVGGRGVKVAVVDLGTNTCRLLLAEVEDGAVLRVAAREIAVVRLGQGVDASGRLTAAAVARTRDRLGAYAARIAAFAPERRLLVATSVLRDAADGSVFLAAVGRDFDLPYRVVGGEDEARLAFRGATSALDAAALAGASPLARRRAPASAPDVAVVDIGGGSSEFAVGQPGAPPRFVRSLDVGAVRLTERFFADDPPTGAQWGDAAGFVEGLLATGLPDAVRRTVGVVVGVAGTFTALVAYVLGMRVYDPGRVHGCVLTVARIEDAIDLFRGLTSAERGRLPGIQKGREDVILAGALIARAACRAFGVPAALVSEADILEGAALWLGEGMPPLT